MNKAGPQKGFGVHRANDVRQPLLVVQGLHKHYRMGNQDLHILDGVNMQVKQGQWLAILGASGSGKSTLLHLVGGLDKPDQGNVLYQGHDIYKSSGRQRNRYRREQIGFVFQFYHLLPELNALENVLIGAMIGKGWLKWTAQKKQCRQRAMDLLDQLGLADRLKHRPSKLSGGERQRVAIARALINQPPVLLADEPTGNLDADTGQKLLTVFQSLHEQGQTIIMVTHDTQVAALADQQLTLEKGKLLSGR